MAEHFYITTTLPYVNAEPHIGFALEIVYADAIARFERLMGREVFFNTGTDEHGLKIYRKALEAGQEPQSYVNDSAAKFGQLKQVLNLSYDYFSRTTDPKHKQAAQEFWRRCSAAGDIYKKNYRVRYCVGCELEKTDSELVNGECPIHPGQPLEIIDEENYFFRFSKYQQALLDFYDHQPDFVLSPGRFNEVKEFVARGLQDFSISRLKAKMPWGIPVPDDSDHVMFVWFDALVNYISAVDWPTAEEKFTKFWGTKDHPLAIQVAGKDNLRQQAAMWQAMLYSAGLPPSKQILIHGFVNIAGQKMSKSRGNVVDPLVLVAEYGTDAVRYHLLRELAFFEDSDFTLARFKETYNANLANGLGNLVSRIMKLAATNLTAAPAIPANTLPDEFKKLMADLDVKGAMDFVWKEIGSLDLEIQTTEPFKLIKTDKSAGQELINRLVIRLYTIGRMLNPLLPATAATIKQVVKDNTMPPSLFPRKE